MTARIGHRSGCARVVRALRHGTVHEDAHWLDGTVDVEPCDICDILALPATRWPREALERLYAAVQK